jgi:SPP1 gp7 family putative phage head morphogenesis protein
MKPEEYWARRMDQLNEAMLAKGEEYIRKQNEEYEKALAKIRKQTEAWYARLAKNNDISLAEARKLLDRNELKEFRWTVEEYIQRGRENAVDQRWMRELENASAKVHITRLQELEMHLRNEIEQLAAKRLKGTTDTLGNIYKDSYYRSVYELQKGTGVGLSFAMLDDRQIDKVLSKPWAPDGSNFSARIWKDRDKLVNELQTILTQDLIRGEPAERVIADFAERMNVSKHAAARLIRTEAAFFSGQSRLDAYREMGVEKYKFVATLDLRTSEICRGMDGKIIPISEAKAGVNYPPLHVYCRSTTIPYFEDAAAGERAARDDGGKTYMVPGDMTYKEWAEKHAPGATEPAKPKAVEPPTTRQVEPPSTPEERQKAAREMADGAREELDEHYKSIAASEPDITSTVTKAVTDAGGEMAGLDYRIKTRDSFIRKVTTDLERDLEINPALTPQDVAKSINDVLRYTAVAEPDRYYSLYAAVILNLINEGHTVKKVKNSWNEPQNPYNGINVVLIAPNGTPYELQFHTPESFDLKQDKLHELYEEYRLSSTSKKRKMELWQEMLKIADGIRRPPGIDRIK